MIYVVEFSLAQKAFHKTTMRDMLDNNLKNICHRFQADYVPIFASENEQEAYDFMRIAGEEIKNYSMFKTSQGTVLVK